MGLSQLGVRVSGGGIRVRNYMVGDNFAHANGCPFWNTSDVGLQDVFGSYLAHIDEGHCSCVSALVKREQSVVREDYTMKKYTWFRDINLDINPDRSGYVSREAAFFLQCWSLLTLICLD